jgi:hypothetical protein
MFPQLPRALNPGFPANSAAEISQSGAVCLAGVEFPSIESPGPNSPGPYLPGDIPQVDSPAVAPQVESSAIPQIDHHCQICPTCSHRLTGHHCKLICTNCGYYLSCADYY